MQDGSQEKNTGEKAAQEFNAFSCQTRSEKDEREKK